MNWYIEALKKYATFRGRASRSEYWYFFLFNFLIQLIFLGLIVFLPFLSEIFYILSIIYTIAIILPSLSVGIRRLHDIGKSGWWYLIILIPFIGAIVLFIFAILDSVPEPNKYGLMPKNNNKLSDNNTVEHRTMSNNEHEIPTRNKYMLVSENPTYPNILINNTIVLGRNGDIVIENDFVSGRHCEVLITDMTSRLDSSNITVRDLNSTNGTYIDGKKLDSLGETFIQEGERLIIGSEEVVYTLKRV